MSPMYRIRVLTVHGAHADAG